MRSLYDSLGISEDASPEGIARAYAAKCTTLEARIRAGDQHASDELKLWRESFDRLNDPARRRQYNRSLAIRRGAEDQTWRIMMTTPTDTSLSARRWFWIGGTLAVIASLLLWVFHLRHEAQLERMKREIEVKEVQMRYANQARREAAIRAQQLQPDLNMIEVELREKELARLQAMQQVEKTRVPLREKRPTNQ